MQPLHSPAGGHGRSKELDGIFGLKNAHFGIAVHLTDEPAAWPGADQRVRVRGSDQPHEAGIYSLPYCL
jgi:hypothetical protein